jgi:hypothetical protein
MSQRGKVHQGRGTAQAPHLSPQQNRPHSLISRCKLYCTDHLLVSSCVHPNRLVRIPSHFQCSMGDRPLHRWKSERYSSMSLSLDSDRTRCRIGVWSTRSCMDRNELKRVSGHALPCDAFLSSDPYIYFYDMLASNRLNLLLTDRRPLGYAGCRRKPQLVHFVRTSRTRLAGAVWYVSPPLKRFKWHNMLTACRLTCSASFPFCTKTASRSRLV